MTQTATALTLLEAASQSGDISPSAAENIRIWLTDARYAEYVENICEHLEQQKFSDLNRVFWKILEFGTGGRRGEMYEIGTAVINQRTMGESAAGLASYVKSQSDAGRAHACAIAYDTRHHSREFARLSAEIMVAAGFEVYFLEGYHSTPCLSFAVRHKGCSCGIMITASHNPPSDNGFKAYWDTGAQLVPPHDAGVIDCVLDVGNIERVDFDTALAEGRITLCEEEVDAAYLKVVTAQAFSGSRNAKILYSPLHGVGSSAVLPVLAADGFEEVEEFALQAAPDGDFPNVPNHVSNPENVAVFDALIERAQQIGADLALATDPDCDRIGFAAPRTLDPAGEWATFNGNQIVGLLGDYVLSKRQQAGSLSADNFVVTTLVTTGLLRRIADSYGVTTYGDLLVGFKWIAKTIDEHNPLDFAFGAEESHGYMVGHYARDKDGPVAAMLAAELAADAKANGESLHDRLATLFRRHGCHAEKTVSVYKKGETGMEAMKAVMTRLREDPPQVLGDMRVIQARDYLHQRTTSADGSTQPLSGPVGDLIMLDFQAEGNYVAVRPSGTEPKIKFYMFGSHPPEDGADLAATEAMLAERLCSLEHDLKQYADG
jgi:phosphoglucomutase/phosphomannomutase